MSGPTRRGIEHRIKNANCGCTPENFRPDCPLLIYIPVVRVLSDKGGRTEVEVTNFAAFFIDRHNPPGSGKESIVTGTFVRNMTEGRVDANLSGYGLYAVNLVE